MLTLSLWNQDFRPRSDYHCSDEYTNQAPDRHDPPSEKIIVNPYIYKKQACTNLSRSHSCMLYVTHLSYYIT